MQVVECDIFFYFEVVDCWLCEYVVELCLLCVVLKLVVDFLNCVWCGDYDVCQQVVGLEVVGVNELIELVYGKCSKQFVF